MSGKYDLNDFFEDFLLINESTDGAIALRVTDSGQLVLTSIWDEPGEGVVVDVRDPHDTFDRAWERWGEDEDS